MENAIVASPIATTFTPVEVRSQSHLMAESIISAYRQLSAHPDLIEHISDCV